MGLPDNSEPEAGASGCLQLCFLPPLLSRCFWRSDTKQPQWKKEIDVCWCEGHGTKKPNSSKCPQSRVVPMAGLHQERPLTWGWGGLGMEQRLAL